jgi:hypothetical protein
MNISCVAGALGLLAVLSACRAAPPEASDHENAASSSQALTQLVTYQRGALGAVSDTSIASSALKKNFGSDAKLRVSAKNEALLRFDLSSIPASAVIDNATLTLYLSGGDDEPDDDGEEGDRHGFPVVPINLHRATAPWEEGTATFASFAQHFDPTVSAILLPTSSNASKSIDVKSLVQAWVRGAQPNYGLVLRTDAKAHTILVSSEGRTVSLRPALAVTYTTPDNHCAPNPCINGGTCANGATTFTCTCPPGFTGTTCQTTIDSCASNPCRNGATCSSGAGTYSCACPTGFTGTNCETDVDACAPNPCQHGGICTDGLGSHSCACPTGYSGADCETLIDSCALGLCQNGGVCTSGVGTEGAGSQGGVSYWPADGNANDAVGSNDAVLRGNATFASGVVGQAFSLDGANGYIEVPDSPSISIRGPLTLEARVKLNTIDVQQGVIEKYNVPGTDGYLFRIIGGKLGAAVCDATLQGAQHPVTGATTVTTGVWHHVAAVYDGTTLEVYLDGILDGSVPADFPPTDGSASLKIGARGDDANTRLDGLIDEVRIHARALSASEIQASAGTGYSCSCAVGFTGTNCEVNIDDCASNPCQNGGTCSDGIEAFTCSCAPGFTGTSCETLIDNCAGLPCQNGGSCTNAPNGYACSCAPGFTGAQCQTDIDECAVDPCTNGGICVDGVSTFTCQLQ